VKKGIKKSTKQPFAIKFIAKAKYDGDLEDLRAECELMLDVMNSPYGPSFSPLPRSLAVLELTIYLVVRLVDVYESDKELILILDLCVVVSPLFYTVVIVTLGCLAASFSIKL